MGANTAYRQLRYVGDVKRSHLVISATRGQNPVGVISHLPEQHRVPLVGDKVLQARQIRLQYPPQLLRAALLSAQLEVSDAFHVVEERVAVRGPFVCALRRRRRGRRVVWRQQLRGLVADLSRDEPRHEHDLCPATGLSDEAGKRGLGVLALLGALRVLVRVEFDGDGRLGAEEEQLGFGFQFGFAFF